MKTMFALKELVEENEKRITLFKRHLAEDESGEKKLTSMIKASTEQKLEDAQEHLDKYRSMLDKLTQEDKEKVEEQERLYVAVQRKNYYHFQKMRLKRDIKRSNDKKLEAMLILDELPAQVQFHDEELFELAEKTIELDLTVHEDLEKRLELISNEFKNSISSISDEDISDLSLLNIQIPIIALHFSVLLENIEENIKKDKNESFHGFPKFEDWWIKELWSSHQAYFALFKWKNIISNLCNSSEQKRAWEVIYSNWVFIKKIINGKGKLAFKYNYAFDTLIGNHAKMQEELSRGNLLSMEEIIHKITKNENFDTVSKDHDIITDYLSYKRLKLGFKDKP